MLNKIIDFFSLPGFIIICLGIVVMVGFEIVDYYFVKKSEKSNEQYDDLWRLKK